MKLETLISDTKINKKEKISSGKKSKEEKEKKKKRKAVDLNDDDDENKSDSSSELIEPVSADSKVKKKKAKLMEASDVEEEENDPNSLSNFRISKPLKDALTSKGIKALFPIQAMTFDIVLDGCDLVGRARTGQVCVF